MGAVSSQIDDNAILSWENGVSFMKLTVRRLQGIIMSSSKKT
jgi:hypothetical protein